MEPLPYHLLRIRDLEAATKLSRSTLYRLIKAGSFPTPRRVAGCHRWRSDEIESWLVSVAGAPAGVQR